VAQQTIIAYFDSRADAEAARSGLLAQGVEASAVALLPEQQSSYVRPATEAAYDHRQDEGGFFASLGDLMLPDEDRYTYAEGLSRGGVALSVRVDEARYGQVADLLEGQGAVDIDAREAEWRSAGWTGYAADATATAAVPARSSEVVGEDGTIQVVEEQLRVGKRLTEAGRVRVRSYVVETPVEADIELRSQHVTIERRPVDRPATAADFSTGERTIEAHERREEAVVAKEARVVEEIGLREQTEVQHQTIHDTVRKTEVELEDERLAAERLRDGTAATSTTGADTTRTTR
jgi:uncharacterized protein (TIGR02271 family)